MKKNIYLVDGSGYIFRAFHALPPLTRPDGTPVGAVLGFTNMLLKLLSEESPDALAVIFDASRDNFRNEIYPEYKANRTETPEDLIPQFGLIREACDAFSVPAIELNGFEADDIIATFAELAKRDGHQVTIVSSDKDLMQLVDDDHSVSMLDPMKNKIIQMEQVVEKFGVTPDKVVDVQALAGDKTDNVPGVPGIGIKTASELINTYGSLDELLNRLEEIKQPKRREALETNKQNALISKELVSLKRDVPLKWSFDDFSINPLDEKKVIRFLEYNSFSSLKKRMESYFHAPSAKNHNTDYQLITSWRDLDKWIQDIHKAGLVAVDTETDSLTPMNANLVGISLSLEENKACYIPVGHHTPKQGLFDEADNGPRQLPLAQVIDKLREVLESPSILKIGQNIKYDMLVFKKYGVNVSPVDDTMVLSYVLDGGSHGHGMDELSELHLDHKTIKYTDVVGTGRSQVTFDKVPLDKACKYAAEDADITLKLYNILKPQVITAKLATVYETMERPLIQTLCNMEYKGVLVDRTKLRKLSDEFSQRLLQIEEEVQSTIGHKFNIGSPKQLGEVLFDKLSLPGGKKGKTGAYSTAASVLEELAIHHPIVERILEWRQLAKLKSTYTDSLVESINKNTGRVHTSYAMSATSTGRLASTDPNLQNIPARTEEGRKIRSAFIAKPGYKLVSLDYSQIELRLLAHMANIEQLKQAFLEGKDIHAITASHVFGVPLDQMNPELRRRAKAINFGIIYGISAWGLSRQLKIEPSEAQKHIDDYFAIYPGIKDYMERMREQARAQGYVLSLFGRRCYTPDINSRDPVRRGAAERQAINAPLQGSNADIIKRAMIKIPDVIKEEGLDAHMLLQVHDELIFEIQTDQVERAIPILKRVMESAAQLSIPMVVDSGIGDNWAEAH